MDNNVIFKSSLFGFDKKEVIDYIALLCKKTAENVAELNELQEEIEKYKQENKSLLANNEKLIYDNSALVKNIDDEKKKSNELAEKIAALEEKVAEINEIEGAEEKANQLMMDSLRYSESCIKKAREVTASINLSTKNKLDKAKNCLDGVSVDFKTLTGKLQDSISEISDKLSNLSSGLDEE